MVSNATRRNRLTLARQGTRYPNASPRSGTHPVGKIGIDATAKP